MKNILIGTPIKNTNIYLNNLLNQINNLSYPKENISLCFVENDSEDGTYDTLKEKLFSTLDFKKYKEINLIKLDLNFKFKHNERHKPEFAKNRIKNLIILRNYIVNNYLKDNDYLWWVDSDIENLPINSIEYLSSFKKDILMPIYYTDHYFHDCASYKYINQEKIRLGHLNQFINNQEICELERSECAAFIDRKVFDSGLRYHFVDEEYVDLCNNIIPCKLEGVSFSEKAKKLGFNIYGCLNFKIKHYDC